MSMTKNEKFDENLSFELPDGYEIACGTDDDGKPYYKIVFGKTIGEDGKESYKYSADIVRNEEGTLSSKDSSLNPFRINGELDNRIIFVAKKMTVAILTFDLYSINILIQDDIGVYMICIFKMMPEKAGKAEIEKWLCFSNDVLDSVVLRGKKGHFEKLTYEMLFEKNVNLDEMQADKFGFPFADPSESQHTHLDFLNRSKRLSGLFGGLLVVNETGAEYSFVPVRDLAKDNTNPDDVYNRVAIADKGGFALSETAYKMSELFRVDMDCFDSQHDREQEIQNGMIQRALVFHAFRSFAWTLAAYCEQNNCTPETVSFDEIEAIVSYINSRDGLNYRDNSFSPVICSGDDLYAFYIPESVSENDKKIVLDAFGDGDDDTILPAVKSLDALRKELEYLYPAVRTIYDSLEQIRDPEEALTGGSADILYAWCSFTYAAREPICSQDGPVNCWWEHPDMQLKYKRDRLLEAVSDSQAWLEKNKNDITENPNVVIKEKTFVFTGVTDLDEWPDILQKLTDMGGVYRTAVSGKTDYLVCYPLYAGDSQLKRVREQKVKGKKIDVILLDDFLKALGMEIKTTEKEIAELDEEIKKKTVKKATPQVVKTEISKHFTFEHKLTATGLGYHMDIPDGFVIKKGEDDREFIAYLPAESNPDDYTCSDFIIFAGKKMENDLVKDFRTSLEYLAFLQSMGSYFASAFDKNQCVNYERTDLPGVIIYSHEAGTLHVNATFGVDDYMQTMRMMISNINIRNRKDYEQIVRSLFDRMVADKPVRLLAPLNNKSFVDMKPDGTAFRQWKDLISEYTEHIVAARAIGQNSIVNFFKMNQAGGKADFADFKKKLKGMLHDTSLYTETQLKKAEYVCLLKRAQYPDNSKFKNSEKILAPLVELADQQVTVDGEAIVVNSDYAKRMKKRFNLPVDKAIASYMEDLTEDEKTEMSDILTKAVSEYKTLMKEKLEEERRKKIEKEKQREEERRKKEEEKKQLEEERRKLKELIRPYCAKVSEFEKIAENEKQVFLENNTQLCEKYIQSLEEKKRILNVRISSIGTKNTKEKKDLSEECARIEGEINRAKDGDNPINAVLNDFLDGLSQKQNEYEQLVKDAVSKRFPDENLYEEALAEYRKPDDGVESGKEDIVDSVLTSVDESGESSDAPVPQLPSLSEFTAEQCRKLQETYEKLEFLSQSSFDKVLADIDKRKHENKVAVMIAAVIAFVLLGLILYCVVISPLIQYNKAQTALSAGQYDEAYAIFEELDAYKDSAQMLSETRYQKALSLQKDEKWEEAITIFKELGSYSDSSDQKIETQYRYALFCEKNNDSDKAIRLFSEISDYKDSESHCNNLMYDYVIRNKNRDDEQTYNYLCQLKEDGYKDSSKIYDSLFAWKVDIVINTSKSDNNNHQSTIEMDSPIYAHLIVSGGAPGELLSAKYLCIYPNGKTYQTEQFDKLNSNSEVTLYWEYGLLANPDKGKEGDFTIKVITDNEECIAQKTVRIVNGQ